MKRYRINPSLIIVLSMLGMAAVMSGCQNKPASANIAPPPPTVTVKPPVVQDVVHYAEFSGTTKAVESVVIRARVEGYLEKILFVEGAEVKKGDLLFTIDDQPYKARLDETRAELAMRQADLKLARATKTRKENALRDRAVSEVEVIDARAQLGKAQAGVAAAEAAVRTAQLNLSYTRVTAPLDGRISRSMMDIGNLVGAGERTQLTTIVKDDPIYAYFNISEREWVRYQAGRASNASADAQTMPVHLGLSGSKDFPFAGRLDFIDNSVDPASGTIEVRAVFDNPKRKILPGLFARIRIPMGQTTGALLVPDSAVGHDQQGRFVLVADKDNMAQYRSVAAGRLVGNLRVISNGLTGEDRVIVNGLQKTRPGGPITPADAKPETPSQQPTTDTKDPSV